MNGMILHCGAKETTRQDLSLVPTPDPTATWTPIPHEALLNVAAENLERSGYRIVSERHALNREGGHYFGLLEVRNGHDETDRSLMIGLRNSHTKDLSAGMAVGNKVFVCDNLSFSGEIRIARMHTKHILEDLPRMVEATMGRLAEVRHLQDRRIAAYRERELTNSEFNDLLIQALDCRAATATALPKILESWRHPEHPEFKERSLWSAFNAFTQHYKELRLAEVSRRSLALHGMCDGLAGLHNGRIPQLDAFIPEVEAIALN